MLAPLLLTACLQRWSFAFTDSAGETGDVPVESGPTPAGCPEVALEPTQVAWSEVAVGAPIPREVLLTNDCTGSAGLDVAAALSADSSTAFDMTAVEGTLQPGQSTGIVITFTAPDYASYTGTLVVESNDADEPTVEVTLAGTAGTDVDGDGYPAAEAGGNDCDDTSASVNPGAEEIWYDGEDQDCDGNDDDQDGDGYPATAAGGTDCDDTDAAVHPGAGEVWYNDVDEDCDGNDDDQDHDGWVAGEDCDDTDGSRSPGATEVWYDGVDQDCDGNDDDQDGDGFPVEDDCLDTDPSAYPGAEEVWYDGVDEACDGGDDNDQDGDGDPAEAAGGTDCDDTDASVSGDTPEVRDLADQDCDGLIDDGLVARGDVLVTEIMYSPDAVSETDGEWFELTNVSDEAIDLVNWTVTADDGDAITVSASLVVDAGAAVVLGVSADTVKNGGVPVDEVYDRGDLALGVNDNLIVRMGTTEIASVEWTTTWNTVDGAAMSLDPDHTVLADADDSGWWCPATSALAAGDKGTPGAGNDQCSSVDEDGDGYSEDEGDCDDGDPGANPAETETWDGVDSDCDGTVDDAGVDDIDRGYVDGAGANTYLTAASGLGLGDVTGDGVPDWLVGGEDVSSGAGGVYVISGAATPAGAASSYDTAFVEGEAANDLGNTAPEALDATGDGVADLLVGGHDASAGVAAALFAGGSGVAGTLGSGDAWVTLADSHGEAGGQVVLADLTGDGVAELVYAEPYEAADGTAPSRGRVAVFDVSGVSGTLSNDAPDVSVLGDDAADYLGRGLASGDLDGDGREDLLLGAPGDDEGGNDAGAWYVLAGGGSSAEDSIEDVYVAKFYGVRAKDRAGAGGAVIADFDADGAEDVALGTFGADSIYVLAAPGSGSADLSGADAVIVGDAGSALGAALAVGDLDGDGQVDLVAGAPAFHASAAIDDWQDYTGRDHGAIWVFAGASLLGATDTGDASMSATAPASGDLFGSVLAAPADVDGDGADEVLVGAARGGSGNAGRAWGI